MDLTALLDSFNLIAKVSSVLGSGVMLVAGRGGGAHFEVLPPGGSCGGDVERMLARYGVRPMWGRRVTRCSNEEPMAPWWIAFDIPAHQARWANYLLQRYGCHVSYRMIDKAAQRAVGMPVPWSGGDHTGIERPQVAGHHAGEVPKPAGQPVKVKRGWLDGLL
jgi:hypothetical protein